MYLIIHNVQTSPLHPVNNMAQEEASLSNIWKALFELFRGRFAASKNACWQNMCYENMCGGKHLCSLWIHIIYAVLKYPKNDM